MLMAKKKWDAHCDAYEEAFPGFRANWDANEQKRGQKRADRAPAPETPDLKRFAELAVSPPLAGEEVEPDFMVAARVNYVSEWNSETLLMSDARVFDL